MIDRQKAEEVVKDILSWLEEKAEKCVLYKADGTKIAETDRLRFLKDANGNYEIYKTNGYVVGKIIAEFGLTSGFANDITLDIATIEGNGTKLAKSLYIGTLPSGVTTFSVVVEVAISYIL
jgi:hypothetical protein